MRASDVCRSLIFFQEFNESGRASSRIKRVCPPHFTKRNEGALAKQ